MLNALKKLFVDDDNVEIVKKGRGRYIKFHSYKIYESGRIETADGKPYQPEIINGKAYLTLKFSEKTIGAAKIEIARIVYSYLVEPIDIVSDEPVISYIDGNGCNFRLDNIEIIDTAVDENVQSLVNEIVEDDSEDIQNVIDETNTGSSDFDDEDYDLESEEDDSEYVYEDLNDALEDMDCDAIDDEIEILDEEDPLSELEELIEAVENEICKQDEESEVIDLPKEKEENVKDRDLTIEEINDINSEAFRLINSDFVNEIKTRENNLLTSYQESERIRKEEKHQYDCNLLVKETEIEKIKNQLELVSNSYNLLNIENQKLKEEKAVIARDCYVVKKEQMQTIFKTFDRLIKMVEEVRK